MKEISVKPFARTNSKALIVISRIGSFVFHPLFMTVLAAILLNKLLPVQFSQLLLKSKRWISELVLYTVLFPLVSILLFRLSGLISNARMHQAKDRILPMIATMIFYIFVYFIFANKYHAPIILQSLLLGSSVAIILMFIINLFYKVSVHTTAAAILPAITIILMVSGGVENIPVLVTACMIALFVGAIRWLMGAHTVGQIVLGYLVGILSQQAAHFYIYSQ